MLELKIICQQILNESNKYNLHWHECSKKYKNEIFQHTEHFPKHLSLSKRIVALAGDENLLKCLACEKIHGFVGKQFCDMVCRDNHLRKRGIEYRAKKEVARTETLKTQGAIQCQICGKYGLHLFSHLSRVHGITSKEYKKKYNVKTIAWAEYSKNASERILGEKNPLFGNAGKYNVFSDHCTFYGSREELLIKRKAAVDKMLQTISENPEKQNTRLEYYTKNGLSLDEAKLARRKRQLTFSKDICIQKHGEEKGLSIWQARQDRWQHTLQSKPPEVIADINRRKMKGWGAVSKSEKLLCEILNSKGIFEVEPQFHLLRENKKNYYIYDIRLGNNIIEYNGDYWHANPSIYLEDHVFRGGYTAKQKWTVDKEKNDYAILSGFDLLVIWEWDFKKQREKTIEQCITFLTR